MDIRQPNLKITISGSISGHRHAYAMSLDPENLMGHQNF